jgi:hypothetical protein
MTTSSGWLIRETFWNWGGDTVLGFDFESAKSRYNHLESNRGQELHFLISTLVP